MNGMHLRQIIVLSREPLELTVLTRLRATSVAPQAMARRKQAATAAKSRVSRRSGKAGSIRRTSDGRCGSMAPLSAMQTQFAAGLVCAGRLAGPAHTAWQTGELVQLPSGRRSAAPGPRRWRRASVFLQPRSGSVRTRPATLRPANRRSPPTPKFGWRLASRMLSAPEMLCSECCGITCGEMAGPPPWRKRDRACRPASRPMNRGAAMIVQSRYCVDVDAGCERIA